MELQEIEVIIDKDGQVRIDVQGVKGMKCVDLTAALEQALGGRVESRDMKAEAYESAEETLEDHKWLKG